ATRARAPYIPAPAAAQATVRPRAGPVFLALDHGPPLALLADGLGVLAPVLGALRQRLFADADRDPGHARGRPRPALDLRRPAAGPARPGPRGPPPARPVLPVRPRAAVPVRAAGRGLRPADLGQLRARVRVRRLGRRATAGEPAWGAGQAPDARAGHVRLRGRAPAVRGVDPDRGRGRVRARRRPRQARPRPADLCVRCGPARAHRQLGGRGPEQVPRALRRQPRVRPAVGVAGEHACQQPRQLGQQPGAAAGHAAHAEHARRAARPSGAAVRAACAPRDPGRGVSLERQLRRRRLERPLARVNVSLRQLSSGACSPTDREGRCTSAAQS
ncbi:uncharacterized protein V1510DRAFT_430786, partial [Dipodascopsis tothii]|uniref:uncharacterized protein n=1 Tax=Dipodascopsis tothii TaxID=44089 RepID=UPI0034CF1699